MAMLEVSARRTIRMRKVISVCIVVFRLLLIAGLAFGAAAFMAPPPPSHSPGLEYLDRVPLFSIALFAGCCWMISNSRNRLGLIVAVGGFSLGCWAFKQTLLLTVRLLAPGGLGD